MTPIIEYFQGKNVVGQSKLANEITVIDVPGATELKIGFWDFWSLLWGIYVNSPEMMVITPDKDGKVWHKTEGEKFVVGNEGIGVRVAAGYSVRLADRFSDPDIY